MNGCDYKYDVYLSFTGADRDLKNDIFARLDALGYDCYDSDSYCMGQFRQNYMEALDKSRVYLMILTDNLRNDPAISGTGTLSEVRKELAVACELEAKNQLNIVILCMSQFFRFADGFHDYNDTIGWLYYTHTRGFSMVYGDLAEGGGLSDRAFHDITSRVGTFIEARAKGAPVISQAAKLEIATESLAVREDFVGREEEISRILDAFRGGKQIVVLSGLGGMGKTTLATEVAARCHRDGLLRVPQIVHVQELGGSRGALHTIVSSVSYTKEVYDSLAYLGERDRYERRLKALSELPENILLVVDNYNALRPGELSEVLEKLSCRLLITTRVTGIESTDRIGTIRLDSMDERTARALFSRRLGKAVGEDEFSPLYRFTGGHTITLCMIAKMLAVHGMSIDTMLSALREEGDVGAKVEFRHNEYGDSNTVLGHLSKLYDMSGFDEGARRVLRAMSILSDGTIKTADLMRVLSLPYKNEIIELARLGWLEILPGENELLYLHPILSHLAARLLLPTAEAVAPMIEYLLASARDAGNTMTYADATVLSERLYYAIHVLGVSEGVLPRELWDAYVALDSLLGDADTTRARAAALAPRLSDGREAALVTSYADMRTLECDPTQLDLLSGYMNELYENAENYKWVMRVLSVSAEFLNGIPACNEPLGTILEKAIDAAMLRSDDFAVYDLLSYIDGKPNFVRVIKKIGRYVRARLRSGECDGALAILSHFYVAARALGKRGLGAESGRIIDTFGNGGAKSRFLFMLRHIPLTVKSIFATRRLEKIPEHDPLYFYTAGVLAVSERLTFEGVLDARRYIELAVNLHIYRTERGHTLVSTAKALASQISYINNLSVPKVKEELALLCEGDVSEDTTVKALSRLQVATLISSFIGDSAAIEQSRRVLTAISRIRPEGHTDCIYAAVSYADNLARFGKGEEALSVYLDVYHMLSSRTGQSVVLAELARKILPLLPASTALESVRAIYESALCDLDPTLYLFYETLDRYARFVFGALRDGGIGGDDPTLLDVMARLNAAVGARKRLSRSAAVQAINTIHTAAVFAVKEDSVWGELCRLLEIFGQGTTRFVRSNAAVQKAELVYSRAANRSDVYGKAEHYLKAISVFVKYGLQINYSCTKLSYILSSARRNRAIADDTAAQMKLLGFRGRLLDEMMAECRALKEEVLRPGVKRLEDLPPERQEKVLSAILARELDIRAAELVRSNFGIGIRQYRRMRSAQDFAAAALRAVFAAIREAYRNSPLPYSVTLTP